MRRSRSHICASMVVLQWRPHEATGLLQWDDKATGMLQWDVQGSYVKC